MQPNCAYEPWISTDSSQAAEEIINQLPGYSTAIFNHIYLPPSRLQQFFRVELRDIDTAHGLALCAL
ncbi:MAG: hypothetical protein ACRD4Q_10690 [Candidatus Acidiferrales bacterium]